MNRLPRCIVLDGHRRCHRPTAQRRGDLFACTRHGLITMAIIDDWLSPQTRRMLAHARWETAGEGQALIDRLSGKAAA